MVMLCALVSLILFAGAAVSDIWRRLIPDAMPIGIATAFGVAVLAGGEASGGWPWHLLAGAIAFAGGAGLFALGLVGGGDVKLLAAAALWSGVDQVADLLLVVAIVGGALGIVVWLASRVRPFVVSHQQPAAGLSDGLASQSLPTVPYGVAIAAGGAMVLVDFL